MNNTCYSDKINPHPFFTQWGKVLQFGIFIFIISINCHSQPVNGKLTLLFAGDIMCHDAQLKSAYNDLDSSFSFNYWFSHFSNVTSNADYTIANLETTLSGPPYKGYPRFSSPPSLAAACSGSGISLLMTANNHITDRGSQGIKKTLETLDSLKICHSGTYLSKEHKDQAGPAIINRNGISIAILNYTAFTNDLNIKAPVHINYLDTTVVMADIAEVRKTNPDFIILYLHWGREYDTIPGPALENTARALIRSGADIIIGTHPHVVQKMVWDKNNEGGRDAVMAYSLGNFISNQSRPGTDGGAVLRVILEKNNGRAFISDVNYLLTWVYKPREDNKQKFYVLPCASFENDSSFFTNAGHLAVMNSFSSRLRGYLSRNNINVNEYRPEKPDTKE